IAGIESNDAVTVISPIEHFPYPSVLFAELYFAVLPNIATDVAMSHFFADDGAKIHLQISGEGSPIVMLHGWTSSHAEWFPFLPALNQEHQVYRWDARGHGGHPLAEHAAPTVERMARDLDNLLQHYGLEQVTAVGHSMGALTLWQYLRDYG